MKDRTAADDIVQGSYNRALLDLILPYMRTAAKEAGYTIATHGSLNRDIDLVCIPWAEHNVWSPEKLIDSICGAIRGITGRATKYGDWTIKPHGRKAITILVWAGENSANLDISIIPFLENYIIVSKKDIAVLTEGMEQLIKDIKTVGDDYPESSCQTWCNEKAELAQNILNKFKRIELEKD